MKHRHQMPFGAELTRDGTRFRLWAPSAKKVELIVQAAPTASFTTHAMQSQPQGWYELTHREAKAGARYRYRIDDGLEVPDPASRFNPNGVHDYSEVIDPNAFEWQATSWKGRPWREAVIYELHIGTFTPEGTYAAIIPRLHELAEIGITAIELMPIASFQGHHGWGYDGVLPYAPHPAYGRPDDLKQLIQAAHDHGIMMLLDVVYNHFGPEGNYLHAYAEQFFTDRHHTPWGQAINFEGEHGRHVRRFFIDNARYWIEEYRFDGLRVDAVHAMLDDSKPHFITDLTDIVKRDDRLIHVVLENHHNESHRLHCAPEGRGCVSQWNDDFHHPLHVLLTGETDGYYEDFAKQPLEQLGRALAEGFVFQGEVSEHEGVARGEPSAHLPPQVFVNFLQTHDQIGNRAYGERLASLARREGLRAGMAITLLAPQTPMLVMGEEYAAKQPFLYFCDFTGELAQAVTRGRRKEFERFRLFGAGSTAQIPDPNDPATFVASRLDWNDKNSGDHRDWLDYTRTLLRARAEKVAPMIPHLRGPHTWRIEGTVLSVEWRAADGATLQLLANLNDAAAPPIRAERGELVFSTLDSSSLDNSALQAWEVRFFKTPPIVA